LLYQMVPCDRLDVIKYRRNPARGCSMESFKFDLPRRLDLTPLPPASKQNTIKTTLITEMIGRMECGKSDKARTLARFGRATETDHVRRVPAIFEVIVPTMTRPQSQTGVMFLQGGSRCGRLGKVLIHHAGETRRPTHNIIVEPVSTTIPLSIIKQHVR
jgi:hypothetical protein